MFSWTLLLRPTVLLVLVIFSPPASPQRCAVTGGGGPRVGAPCVFPFRFRGLVFEECTSRADEGGRPWCSTRVDADGRHVSGDGQWGYCDATCRLQER